MKTLLFITAFPPNNKSGGQVFTLNALNDLSKSYIIDLVYFTYKNHDIDKNVSLNSIKSFDVNNFNCLRHCTKHPVFTRRFNYVVLQYLANIINNYDIVFFDYTQVGIYSLYLNHPYKIIRCHDVMYQKFSRKNKIFKNWVALTEKKILESVQKIFVPTNKDVDIVKNQYGFNAYFTHEYIKNFIFYEYLKTEKIFLFFGLWSRPENLNGLIWFIKKVLPFVNPDSEIKFLIIGDGLSEKIKQKYLSSYKNIKYWGFVEDPLEIIYKSSALIAPLFTGAGVKIKVIDAFVTGTPVIGTEIAFEGLPFIESLTFLADKAETYLEIIHEFPILSADEKRENAKMFRSKYGNYRLSEQL